MPDTDFRIAFENVFVRRTTDVNSNEYFVRNRCNIKSSVCGKFVVSVDRCQYGHAGAVQPNRLFIRKSYAQNIIVECGVLLLVPVLT